MSLPSNPNPNVLAFKGYMGSPKLKRVGINISLSQYEMDEYRKCAADPNYFIERYVKIITLDKGLVSITLYPFQRDAVTKITQNREVIIKAGRQVGKTTMTVGVLLWYILFNEAKTVAILANKAKTAREILNRLRLPMPNAQSGCSRVSWNGTRATFP